MAGCSGGIGLILCLNTLRIGSSDGRRLAWWFNTLHLYVCLQVLMLAIAGYAFAWMRVADQPSPRLRLGSSSPSAGQEVPACLQLPGDFVRSRRDDLILLTAAFMLLFIARHPWIDSTLVPRWPPSSPARPANARRGGVSAHATTNILLTPARVHRHRRSAFPRARPGLSAPSAPVIRQRGVGSSSGAFQRCLFSSRWASCGAARRAA